MRSFKPTKKYWRAYEGLFGEVEPSTKALDEPSVKPRKKRQNLEQQLQIQFSTWLKKKNVVHHHSPNGGRRSYVEGCIFQRMGTSAGFPDIFIPYSRKGYHGLYFELKVGKGKLNDNQIWWRDFLLRQGNQWHEGRTLDECIRFVESYFR
jgi:hypothetical protein